MRIVLKEKERKGIPLSEAPIGSMIRFIDDVFDKITDDDPPYYFVLDKPKRNQVLIVGIDMKSSPILRRGQREVLVYTDFQFQTDNPFKGKVSSLKDVPIGTGIAISFISKFDVNDRDESIHANNAVIYLVLKDMPAPEGQIAVLQMVKGNIEIEYRDTDERVVLRNFSISLTVTTK
ncbi:MAG: hypothetical protein HGA31_06205 [Candidatus Moranbacteria bacterium]|jgi:hypothetical protein|nr:hypothetical protein [Candidatus Moranbacteria bacterium]